MDLKEFSNLIWKSAPLLSSAISDVNPLAGQVINLIANAFSADPNDLNGIANKINNDPEAKIKLMHLNMDYAYKNSQLQIDDRKNAREREEDIVKITGKRDWLLEIIAVIVITGYFIMCALIVFNKLQSENNQVIYMMFGQLTGGFIMVLSYYFGSSKQQAR